MRLSKFVRVLSQGAGVTVLVASMGLAACGKSSSTPGVGSSKVITIASELPVTGSDAGDGLPTQNGVELAVSQATLTGGYTLKFESKNDVSTTSGTHDPGTGATNLTALGTDPTVLGVVGPFNSSVAVAEIPVANNLGLTLISPSNTNPGLTLSQYALANNINFAQLHPSGLPDCYYRLPGNDVVQGGLLAKIALTAVPGVKPAFTTAYVVDDNETYGVGLSAFFTAAFTAGGGTVVGHDSITQNQASALTSLATKIKAAKPQFVFYGGVTSNGGGTLKADLGASTVMEGGDGIADDPSWLSTAGAAAANTFGTVAAPDTSGFTSTTAKAFVSSYTAKYGSAPIPYSAQSFDAANVIISAIQSVITAGQTPTRANVCAAVGKINYTGTIGPISFDQFGDNSGQKVFSVYATAPDGKSWVFQQEVPVTG